MEFIKGSRFLITGATSGIGFDLANTILKYYPSSVFVSGYQSNEFATLNRSTSNVTYGKFDFTNLKTLLSDDFINFVKDSKPNYIINCAGDVIRRSSFLNSDINLYIDNMFLNYHSVHQLIRIIVANNMLRSLVSSVFISSISARIPFAGDSLHYACSKSALETFIKGISVECSPSRFNCIAPSAISTRFQDVHSSEERLERIINQTPMARIGTVEDVTNLTLFLLSNKSSYITGSIIPVTGGR